MRMISLVQLLEEFSQGNMGKQSCLGLGRKFPVQTPSLNFYRQGFVFKNYA